MNLTSDQKSWLISIVFHTIIISILSLTWTQKVTKDQVIQVPVTLQIIKEQPKPKKVVARKKTVATKKALPVAKKVEKPTSLPGDRNQPIITDKLQPVYPKKALNNDWEGTVKVKVTISSGGQVTALNVIQSSGYDILDDAFIRAIRQYYVFKPKRTMGKDVNGSIILTHSFKIGDAM